jgi:hypothetical protein
LRKGIIKEDGLGPGAYNAKMADNSQKFSFGARFDSSIRNKNHLRPNKVDGPGPGSHKLPSSVKTPRRPANSKFSGTFGSAGR